MKVRVVDRFVGKGRIIQYPGQIIDMSLEMADKLILRGIVEPADGQPYETTAEYAEIMLEQRAKSGGCGGCPKKKMN